MEFNWFSLFGAVIVILIMIPNIIYALKRAKETKTEVTIPKYLSVCEQIGRYGCIVLMWLPLFVREFGLKSVSAFLIYFFLNGILLLTYFCIWSSYFKKKSFTKGILLAIIPAVIFVLSGFLLRHWCLVGFALLFGLAHGIITYMTHAGSC